jgi:hypothetical protein
MTDWLFWDLDSIPLGTTDPADQYRPATRPATVRPPMPEMTPTDIARYVARWVAEAVDEIDTITMIEERGEPAGRARQRLLARAEAVQTQLRLPVASGRFRHPRDLLDRLGADPNRDRGVIRCPAHEDRSASLSWREAGDIVLLHCFAGCTFDEIRGAVA